MTEPDLAQRLGASRRLPHAHLGRLINCPVTVSSVRAAYRVDFLATYGSDHELIWY